MSETRRYSHTLSFTIKTYETLKLIMQDKNISSKGKVIDLLLEFYLKHHTLPTQNKESTPTINTKEKLLEEFLAESKKDHDKLESL